MVDTFLDVDTGKMRTGEWVICGPKLRTRSAFYSLVGVNGCRIRAAKMADGEDDGIGDSGDDGKDGAEDAKRVRRWRRRRQRR